MTKTFDGPDCGQTTPRTTSRSTWGERAIVLGGFAMAALHTAVAAIIDTGMETVGAAWLAAVAWTVLSSLALALRRGLLHRDWSAFGRYRLPDNGEQIDYATRSGAYAYMRVAEEHERLMRGD